MRGYDIYVEKVKPTFEEWSRRLKAEFGPSAEPHLRKVWAQLDEWAQLNEPELKPSRPAEVETVEQARPATTTATREPQRPATEARPAEPSTRPAAPPADQAVINPYQRIVLGLGVIAIAIMALFPPWMFTYQRPGGPRADRFAGYLPIWQSNTPSDIRSLQQMFSVPLSAQMQWFSIRLDTTRLGIQIAATLIVTLLLTALLKSKGKRGTA